VVEWKLQETIGKIQLYMGNKKNRVWILELFANTDKTQPLKVYELLTMRDVGYVLDMRPTTVSTFTIT
jgi:hypothetical protein